MKKLFLFLLFAFISKISFAQLSDGDYTYSNAEIILNFTVADDGQTLNNVVLVYNNTKSIETGKGNWFFMNLRGASPDYNGPTAWYQFQTDQCNFDFELPASQLVLSRFDCKNKKTEAKFVLNRSN